MFAGVAEQIETHLPPVKQCVDSNVGPAQRASFAYFGHVKFAETEGMRCDFLLLQDSIADDDSQRQELQQYPGRWRMLWEGRRPSDRDERFRLYRRIN